MFSVEPDPERGKGSRALMRSCDTGEKSGRQIKMKRLLLFDFIREVGLANAKC